MNSNQTVIAQNEEEKEVSDPMNETNKPIDSDPIEEKENPVLIKGFDEKANSDAREVAEEEKQDEIVDTKLEKEGISDAKLEKGDLDDGDKGNIIDAESEKNGVSDGQVGENNNTVVEEEKKVEETEAQEEKDLVSGDKEGKDEKVGAEDDTDEKIQGRDSKIKPQNEEEEEKGDELEKSSSIDGGEKGETLDSRVEKDETSLPSVETEPEKVQKAEEIEVPKAEKDAEIEGEEVPNPNPTKREEIDESEGSEVPNPSPNPSHAMAESPSNVEEAKPETIETAPVIGAADANNSINNGFAKHEVLEGLSENKDTNETEGDAVIKGENESHETEGEGISENIETKEVESIVNSSKIKGENESLETEEQDEGISENNVTKEIKGDANSNEIKGETENRESEEERENSEIAGSNNNFVEFTGDELDEDEMEGLDAKPARVAILESSKEAKEIMKEIEEDGQIVTDSDEEREYREELEEEDDEEEEEERENEEDEDEEREVFDSDALAELLRAATGTDGNIRVSSQDSGTGTGSRVFSFDRPAGLGSSAPVLRPAAPRSYRSNPNSQLSPVPVDTESQEEEMSQEEKTLHEKVENIRVKFLRLVYRSGHSPEDTVAAQVLYRLSLAEGIRRGRTGTGRNSGTESARRKALELEAIEADLDFSCNILVLGKTGVGKSATINSIFGSEVTGTSAFVQATRSVREITGTVDGIKFRVLDTPGLKTSIMDQNANCKILSSVKSYMKKCPPDIVLYIDRMDTQTRDLNDLPLLRTITSVLGSSIWFNAIVCLTHAGTAPPDGPNGTALTYEVFVAQRSHVVQQMVRQAAGDMRLMNPVSLIENHILCRRNTNGHKVLPNGLSWRQQLLLLCYSSKILSEANGLLKLQDASSSVASKLFGFRFRSPPLPFLLSSLLQTRAHPKLVGDNGDGNGDSDLELDDFSDHEEEEEDEYESLPPFKPLKKAQFEKLTKEQKRAYFEEYEYRVKLLQKKQWRDEVRRMKEMKRAKENSSNFGTGFGTEQNEEFDQDNAPASVPVPLPDMVLPPSFDSDGPTYRYRFLEPTSGFLARPVLDTHGWDHDVGYDGVSLEETLTLIDRFPANATVQVTKDKKEFSIHLESSVSAKHGDNGSSLLGFDIQTIGRQLGYILRGETKLKSFKRNKTTGGLTLTFLGDIIATGAKFEDQITLGKRVTVVASTGLVRAQGDTAYGANLEARLRDKDYPIGQALTTLGLSLMKWRGDLAIGANLQSQIPIGFGSKVALRVGLNNKLSGQITVRTSTSEQVQIALLGIVPVAVSLYRNYFGGGNGGGESFAY